MAKLKKENLPEINPNITPVLFGLESSNSSVSDVYQALPSFEEQATKYFSELREQLTAISIPSAKDYINNILEKDENDFRIEFNKLLYKLKKAIERGRGKKMCVDVFRPIYIV